MQSKNASRVLSILGLVVLQLNAAPSFGQNSHGNPNPGVVPIQANYAGKSYAEWSASWWQWLYETFTPTSPLLDATGASAGVGQSGPVFFLAFPFLPNTVRNITVPAGKAILFPCSSGDVLFSVPPWATLEERIAAAEAGIAITANSQGDVDGVEIKDFNSYWVISEPFTATFTPDNIIGIPSGQYGPDVAGGHWILLTPMSVGQHTIHFSWDTLFGFFQGHWDETYNITVTPGK